MRENLKINGLESYANYKVVMGKGFIDAIEAPCALKDYIENDSRLEHGTRVIVNNKLAKRAVTLMFNIHGVTEVEYLANKKAFENLMYAGRVIFQIIGRNEIYKMVYTGKSVTYKHSYNGKFGTVSMQFIEPNPADRY